MKDEYEQFIWNESLELNDIFYCIDNPNKTLSTIGLEDNDSVKKPFSYFNVVVERCN